MEISDALYSYGNWRERKRSSEERSEKQGECYQRADCDLWLERREVARKAEELVGARRSTTLARR